ncbi:MAG: chitobiase/beta-hexosaminidase C-terminal domain-containing protein [Sediminibacterium sp.]
MRVTQKYIFNIVFGINILLLFLVVFENSLAIPVWLQVAGRMHPLLLHFPITLVLLFLFWHFVVVKKIVGNEWIVNIDRWLLLFTAFTASITALMGLFLSKEDGYDVNALQLHKWSGIAIAVITTVWYAYSECVQKIPWLHYTIAGLSTGIILFTGHQGGTITHGPNFLLAPIQSNATEQPILLADAEIYTHLVQPILQTKCYSCHNDKKSKGELRMDTESLLLKGGKNGKLWDSAASDLGLLMHRVHLPVEDKKHMPPIGKPQLTETEIQILAAWIKKGANFKSKIASLPENDDLYLIAKEKFNQKAIIEFDFEPASKEIVQELNTDYRVVSPITKLSPALQVDFFSPSAFSFDQLKELLSIKKQIVSLNLNKMPVQDDALSIIAQFNNLQKLNLSFTQITGKNLDQLKQLPSLQQLSLSGTKVEKKDLLALASLKNLSQLFIWNTNISAKDIVDLKKNMKTVLIENGFNDDTSIIKLTPPILLNEEQVITTPIKLKLKHYINGASIRYTLDGTEPDSINAKEYTADIILAGNTTVKAKAFKKGWISSNTIETYFFSSKYKPDSAVNILRADDNYRGDGPSTLIDLAKGELNNFKTRKWLGYKLNRMESLLLFNSAVNIKSVTLSTLIDIGSYIMPPKSIEVWGGNELNQLKLLGRLTPPQPTAVSKGYLKGYEINFAPASLKYLKVIAVPISILPKWHPGKGDKGWVFVDEVYVN